MGCGDLDTSAPECIKPNGSACAVLFVSKPGATGRAVDGAVDLDPGGDFTGGLVKLGSVQRSGCVGTWSPAIHQMAVNCGGTTPSTQMCTVTLTRAGASCGF